MSVLEILSLGNRIVGEVVERHGFRWHALSSGNSSGGEFAAGEFRRNDRALEFSFRRSLGCVQYRMGELALRHTELMRQVVPPGRSSCYPGFSNDPLDGFRHLALDLSAYCQIFLSGTDAEFRLLCNRARARGLERPRLP